MYKLYNINVNYFEKIDTPNKAYFLGLMFADGYVGFRFRHKNSKNQYGQFCIFLQMEDSHIIESFKEELEYSGNLKSRKQNGCKDQTGLVICSTKMSRDLEKLGCVEKKSLILKFPNVYQVPDDLIHHFIRGIFDGDGSINKFLDIKRKRKIPNYNFSITGTNNICESINKIFFEILEIPLQKVKNYDTYSVYSLSGNNNIRKIYNYLYKDATKFLTRKKDKMVKVFDYNDRLNNKGYSFDKIHQVWIAGVKINNKLLTKICKSEEDAKEARLKFLDDHDLIVKNIID